MNQFNSINIQYKPAEIGNELVNKNDLGTNESSDNVLNQKITDKLLDHIRIIKDYRDRIDAIDYLISGANKLAGNPEYSTKDQYLISDIKSLGGTSNKVDFELFKKSVDIVIEGYEKMALVGMTGVLND